MTAIDGLVHGTREAHPATHRALELRGAEDDSAHGHLHHALIAARLRDLYEADAAHTLPAVLIEMLVQSTPHRLVLLPALPPELPAGRLTSLQPTRTVRIEVRTSPGAAEPIDLVAGEDHVLSTRAW